MSSTTRSIRTPYVILHEVTANTLTYIAHDAPHVHPSLPLKTLDERIRSRVSFVLHSNITYHLEYYAFQNAVECEIPQLSSTLAQFANLDQLESVSIGCNPDLSLKDQNIDEIPDSLPKKRFGLAIVISNLPKVGSESRDSSTWSDEDEVHYEDREDIVNAANECEPPSTGCEYNNFRKLQKSSVPDALYNARPLSLSPTPISVYEPAFATFMEEMAKPITEFNFTAEEYSTAFRLVAVSSALYRQELDLQTELAKLRILGITDAWVTKDWPVNNSVVKPDGSHKIDWHKVFVLAVNMELKLAAGRKGDPEIQCKRGYTRVVSADAYSVLRLVSCCPAFLISQAGTMFSVWGAVFADKFFFQRLAYVYLAPKASCGGEQGLSGMEETIIEVAKLLRVLKNGVQNLESHYKDLPQPPPSLQVPSSIGPIRPTARRVTTSTGAGRVIADNSTGRVSIVINSDRRILNDAGIAGVTLDPGQCPHWRSFKSDDSIEYTIGYQCRLTIHYNKAVFLAKITGNDGSTHLVVVKFAHQYCKAAHQLLANNSTKLAPKLFFAEYIGGASGGPGMWAIVMEFIDQGAGFNCSRSSLKQKDLLGTAMDILHNKNFVYGDLRRPNVILRGAEELYLIDFDWCGLVGVAKYPLDIQMSVSMNWPDGVKPGALITRDHDRARLAKLLNNEF